MENKNNQGMYDIYEEYKETLRACKVPLRKRQKMNREIREKYFEPYKRLDHKANVSDITNWNSMISDLENEIKDIEMYLDFDDRHFLHREYNNAKSMILNPNSHEGEIPFEALYDEVVDDVADIVCDVDLQDEIVDILADVLTKRQQQVVNLYFWEGKTHEQIADLLKIDRTTVTKSLQNSVKTLQKHIKLEDFDCFY